MHISEPNIECNRVSRLASVISDISKLNSDEMALLNKMLSDQVPAQPWNQISPQLLNYAKVGFSSLTPRELQVLQEITRGKSNKVAAKSLQISHRTVEIHRSRVMQKLGARNVVDLCNLYSAICQRDDQGDK